MIIKINLIPQDQKDEINNSRQFFHFLRLEIQIMAIVILFVFFLFGINYILGINLSAQTGMLNNSIEGDTKFSDIRKYDMELDKINSQIADISKIQRSQLYWSKFFLKLNDSMLPVITVKDLINKGYYVSIHGEAKRRDDLMLFKENLEKENCFAEVNLPLSNLAAKTDVEFKIDFKINEECLSKKNNETN